MYNLGGRIDLYGFGLIACDGDLNHRRWAVSEGRMPSDAGIHVADALRYE